MVKSPAEAASRADSAAKVQERGLVAQQMQQFRALLHTLDEQLLNLRKLVAQLDELAAAPDGAPVLVPVANGIFAPGTLEKPADLFVNVGADIVVKKGLSETQAMLEAQIKELEGYREEALADLAAAAEHLRAA